MDCLIRRFDATPDNDLMLCEHRGLAYQRDMSKSRMNYDAKYWAHYQSLLGTPTDIALNAGRCALVARHVPAGSKLLDVGIGNGSFVLAALRAGYDARGTDINPEALAWLKGQKLHADDVGAFDAVTLWDSIEHMEDPHLFLRNVARGATLFAAIPVFEDLRRVRKSKHYKPGEHLYYFGAQGFTDWMALHGFRLLETSAHETQAGRESIAAFAFRKDLPDYRDHVALYMQMHEARHYGSSATELHLERAAKVVRKLKPHSILDYGCGRSDLVAHFWRDGERSIARFDPAIPMFKRMPQGRFDLAFVCDVMEHIPMADVDRVLSEVKAKSVRALFTISTKLARAKLPDGRNAHVTLLTRNEWSRWIRSAFGSVQELQSDLDHELVLLAGPKEDAMKAAA